MKQSASLICGLLLLTMSLPATSDIWGNERFRLSGFGTFGLTQSDDDVHGYRRNISREGLADSDWSLKSASLIGIQLDADLSQHLHGSLQLVAQDNPRNNLDSTIKWAYLGYQPNNSWTLRGGRLGLDMYMLSEYRNVGFAYLWAHPPMEFYGALPFDRFDGLDLSYSKPMQNGGRLNLKLFGGMTDGIVPTYTDDLAFEVKPVFGGSLSLDYQKLLARVSIATARFDKPLAQPYQLGSLIRLIPAAAWPEADRIAGELDAEGERLYYYSAGISYDTHPWITQAEISYLDSNFKLFKPLLSGYLSIGYRKGPYTFYGIGSYTKNTEDREIVPAPQVSGAAQDTLHQAAQALYDRGFYSQKTLGLGLRWDIQHDLALKAQWDRTWVDPYGGALWIQRSTPGEERTIDTFSLHLDFLF